MMTKGIGGGFTAHVVSNGVEARKNLPERKKLEVIGRKTLGRLGKTGVTRLRKLSQRHIKMVSMHLTGDFTGTRIAEAMGVSVATVYNVLADPLVQEIVKDFRAGQMTELHALFPKAVETIRDGLDEENGMELRLKAVDRYMKMAGIEQEEGRTGPSIAITINNAREHFVDVFREMRDVTPLVEEGDV